MAVFLSPDERLEVAEVRNRVKELRVVSVADLRKNPANFRVHPVTQQTAMKGALHEIGITDVLKCYHSPRAQGALTLINGHLRADIDPRLRWPAIIVDLTDEEADKDLAFADSIGSLAEIDTAALGALLQDTPFDSPGMQAVLDDLYEHAQRLDRTFTAPPKGRDEGERTYWPALSFKVPPAVEHAWARRLGELGGEPYVLLASLLGVDPFGQEEEAH